MFVWFSDYSREGKSTYHLFATCSCRGCKEDFSCCWPSYKNPHEYDFQRWVKFREWEWQRNWSGGILRSNLLPSSITELLPMYIKNRETVVSASAQMVDCQCPKIGISMNMNTLKSSNLIYLHFEMQNILRFPSKNSIDLVDFSIFFSIFFKRWNPHILDSTF